MAVGCKDVRSALCLVECVCPAVAATTPPSFVTSEASAHTYTLSK